VTYPSSRLHKYHVRVSGGIDHPSDVIPHIGYAREKKNGSLRKFRLVHAGKLGGVEDRSTQALLRGIDIFLKKFKDARADLRFLLVGAPDPATDAASRALGLEEVVETTGIVSYERSLELINSASVCVLVEGRFTEGIFLPSKLADYVTAGKPVLALSPKIGTITDLLTDTGITRVDTDDAKGVAAALGLYFHAFRHRRLNSFGPSEGLARRFAPQSVVDQFCLHAEKMIKGQARRNSSELGVPL
jgi:glycosyltransferase involved in cell wall biosynthesis